MNGWNDTYFDILQLAEKGKQPLNLLIGNGFSIAFDDVFRILESDNQNAGDRIGKMFSLKGSIELDDPIDSDNSKTVKIQIDDGDRKRIYNNIMFFEVSRKHPDNIDMMRLSEAKSCCNFITPYLKRGKIFSLNYDLLIHWAIIKAREYMKNIQFRVYDGFTIKSKSADRMYWKKSNKQNLYYLHGAIELEADGRECYRTIDFKHSLGASVADFFDNEHIPLIVSADDPAVKYSEIQANDYLNNSFEALKRLSGTLVILGLSFRQNDNHIIKALSEAQENGLSIYYGCFSDNDYDNAMALNELHFDGFFDSSTANIWRGAGQVTTGLKYSLLEKELNSKKHEPKHSFVYNFSDIEEIIGTELPPSAYKYKAWWTNNLTHPQARAWINAGFRTKLPDIDNQRVTFIKERSKI